MLSVTYKPFMLSVIVLNVVMLNVVAPVLFTPLGYVGSKCPLLPSLSKALKGNRKDPKKCFGQVFNSKFGHFYNESN